MKNLNNHVIIECPVCKKIFLRKKSQYNWKIERGQKTFCCSKFCSSKFINNLGLYSKKGILKSETYDEQQLLKAILIFEKRKGWR